VARFVLDLSEAQAAVELGCTVGTVKSLTSRGVAQMMKLLSRSVHPVHPDGRHYVGNRGGATVKVKSLGYAGGETGPAASPSGGAADKYRATSAGTPRSK
ncbi:sigma factor-like helix-turn-helix DNA-binding protein, partial [Actinokineospora sp. NPDC004072]